jgi:hypothetical protein
MSSTSAAAYSGSPPGNVPVRGVFDFVFSQPFQTACDFLPPAHRLPQTEAGRPIFVDSKSSGFLYFDVFKPSIF